MLGDVWEWTSSFFAGYPGFRAHPYPEYSEVFFDDRYRVLRGGSWATRARVLDAEPDPSSISSRAHVRSTSIGAWRFRIARSVRVG